MLLTCIFSFSHNVFKHFLSQGVEIGIVRCRVKRFNQFPHDSFGLNKLKVFADDKIYATKITISVFDKVENIVRKGEIACTSNFSFSPQCFHKASFPDPSKGVTEWEWVCQKVSGRLSSGRLSSGLSSDYLNSYIRTSWCFDREIQAITIKWKSSIRINE